MQKLRTMFRTILFCFILTGHLTLGSDETRCNLELPSSSPDFKSSCINGDWGGFLNKNCCGSAFPGYIYALGKRANLTGLIFLNSSQQTSCLSEISSNESDALACGTEKLTSGGGGCSDFTVEDVAKSLESELRNLEESCRWIPGSDGDVTGWNENKCGSCVKSWQEIVRTGSDDIPDRTEIDLCRFAVLISLTSHRIGDEVGVQRVYHCLEKQNFAEDDYFAAREVQKMTKTWKGAWIVTGVVTVVMALLIIVMSILTIRYISSRRRISRQNPLTRRSGFQEMKLDGYKCPKFTIKEIYSATDNLSGFNLTGEGTAGKVYKGVLPNSSKKVAIKHIVNDGNAESVVREVTSLSHVRHPNLVVLLGCCVGDDECFLVYEFCNNGNLSQWIFGKQKCLSWIKRLEIAMDSARGLWFLHTYSQGCIVHRDVKPTNILLGSNFEAKLSDFGLSKLIDVGETHMSSEVRGTFGYVDPEYQNNHRVDSMGDVYSFGVVLLQIISGKKVINMNMKEPRPLHKMAKALTNGGSISNFADPKMMGEYCLEAFKLVFELALLCTGQKQERPTMEKVVIILEQTLNSSTRQKRPIHLAISVSKEF
ncbi:Probable receptor-like protein kinase At2g42960 [Linum perenne]